MRRAAFVLLGLCLGAARASLAADEAPPKTSPAIEGARKAFQQAATKIYAGLISGLSEEHRREISSALSCDGVGCAEKAAELLIRFCPAFTLSDDEAAAVLAGKFDDAANDAVVRSCARCLEALGTPLPLLFRHLIDEVTSKKIQGGIELELAARFLSFHASKAARLVAEKTAAK